MGSVAFFDLDKTLLDVNSGRLWIRREWRDRQIGAFTLVKASFYLARYKLGHEGLEAVLDEAAGLYEGVPLPELVDRIERWFNDEVRHRLRPGARQALQQHRDAGDTLVLATTSSQFAAECARRAFGLDDTVSTVIEHEDGVLTGRIAASAYGHHKRTRVETWALEHGVELADATFYTDSVTDLPLLEAVGTPVVVHPDRRLAAEAEARDWPVVDWGSAS